MTAARRIALLLSLALLPLVGCASYELDASAAYSRAYATSADNAGPFIDETGGYRLAAGASRSFVVPGLLRGKGGLGPRLGVNVSSSSYDRSLGGVAVGEPAQTAASGSASLWTVSPQATASFRLPALGWFVEPGIGGGGVYGEIDADYTSGGGSNVNGTDESFSWAYRPYVRLGRVNDWFLFALEGGYERTGLDFDVGPGEDYENWYVGATIGFRLTN